MGLSTGRRATWVWDRPAAGQLVEWSVRHDVAEILVAVGPGPDHASDRWLREVTREARRAGIKVAALGGDRGWIDEPTAALAWLRRVLATGPFDGVHLDVEFWARSDWTSRRPEVIRGYLALLGSLAPACPVATAVDLGASLDDVRTPSGEPLYAAAMRLVDAATVLSYRNTVSGPDSIASLGAAALAAAASARIPCRLAVETRYLGDDPVSRKQTFHHLGSKALSTALRQVDELHATVPSYAGVAIHDYRGWRAL